MFRWPRYQHAITTKRMKTIFVTRETMFLFSKTFDNMIGTGSAYHVPQTLTYLVPPKGTGKDKTVISIRIRGNGVEAAPPP